MDQMKEPVDIAIVGAGPAGAALALLLARQGVSVALLERRADFSREFRGEVLMPSGLSALDLLDIQEPTIEVPSKRIHSAQLNLNGHTVVDVDFEHLATPLNIWAVSQPALLEMLVGEAASYPNFQLIRGAAVKELMRNASGRVTGVRYTCEQQSLQLRAALVVGADGRNSAVRKHSGIKNQHASPPMDIVWCKVPSASDTFSFEEGVRAYAGRGHLLVAYRTWDDALQIGWVILKGNFGSLRERGIPEWVDKMADHVSDDFAEHLRAQRESVDRPFLLDTVSDCVEHWSLPGVLLIGDAAHTMSPVGGQGVNLALRDAIVTANHLRPLFEPGTNSSPLRVDQALKAIEAERMPEIAPIQQLQAAPPRLILSRSWWGEPLRWLASRMLKLPLLRARFASRLGAFFFGVTEVRLLK